MTFFVIASGAAGAAKQSHAGIATPKSGVVQRADFVAEKRSSQ